MYGIPTEGKTELINFLTLRLSKSTYLKFRYYCSVGVVEID